MVEIGDIVEAQWNGHTIGFVFGTCWYEARIVGKNKHSGNTSYDVKYMDSGSIEKNLSSARVRKFTTEGRSKLKNEPVVYELKDSDDEDIPKEKTKKKHNRVITPPSPFVKKPPDVLTISGRDDEKKEVHQKRKYIKKSWLDSDNDSKPISTKERFVSKEVLHLATASNSSYIEHDANEVDVKRQKRKYTRNSSIQNLDSDDKFKSSPKKFVPKKTLHHATATTLLSTDRDDSDTNVKRRIVETSSKQAKASRKVPVTIKKENTEKHDRMEEQATQKRISRGALVSEDYRGKSRECMKPSASAHSISQIRPTPIKNESDSYIGTEFDKLSAMDAIWCPVRVVAQKGSTLTLKYIGWDDTWNEQMHLSKLQEDSTIATARSHVIKYKAWVKLYPNLPRWPGVVFVRTPEKGSAEGVAFLKEEKRLYVELYGLNTGVPCLKPFRLGFWKNFGNISPINRRRDEWEEQGIAFKNVRIADAFRASLSEMESDMGAKEYSFLFDGTLEVGKQRDMKAALKKASLESLRREKEQRIEARRADRSKSEDPPPSDDTSSEEEELPGGIVSLRLSKMAKDAIFGIMTQVDVTRSLSFVKTVTSPKDTSGLYIEALSEKGMGKSLGVCIKTESMDARIPENNGLLFEIATKSYFVCIDSLLASAAPPAAGRTLSSRARRKGVVPRRLDIGRGGVVRVHA